MRQINLDGADTDYSGTVSNLTKFGTLLTSHARTTAKTNRGRYRGNARKPRNSAPAVTSECVSYTLGDDGAPENVRIFSAARKPRATRATAPRASRNDTAAIYAAQLAVGNNSDVD